jgi:hypothetical protein
MSGPVQEQTVEEWWARWRNRLADRFLHYREGMHWRREHREKVDFGGREIKPEANPPNIYLPLLGLKHSPVPFHHFNSAGVKFRLDDILTEKQLEDNEARIEAFRNLAELKDYFASLPDAERFKYRRCLGWGGNGLAAAFDVMNDSGQKIRSIVVKTLFSDSPTLMEDETRCRMFE